MKKEKVLDCAVGGLVIGTVAVATVSILTWSTVPIFVWATSCAVIGSQTVNIMKIIE